MSEPISYSPKSFCKVSGMSLSLLYKLWRDGDGPPHFKAGARTIIPGDGAREWMKRKAEAASAERTA